MIELLILGLATWRISSLFVYEDGPWFIFLNIRKWAGLQYDDLGRLAASKENLLAGALSCLWCFSIWVALVFAVLYLIQPDITLKIATALSFSTVAIIIDSKLVNR